MRELPSNRSRCLGDLFAGPSRSSPAIKDACKLAGTARIGGGIAAAVRSAASSLSASRTAFVISSMNRGIPSVRSMMSCRMLAGRSLLPITPSIIASMQRFGRRLKRNSGDARLSDPGRRKFRPERNEQQNAKGRNSVYNSADDFQARRVGPMRILEDHQNWTLSCQRFHLGNERLQSSLSALLWGEV